MQENTPDAALGFIIIGLIIALIWLVKRFKNIFEERIKPMLLEAIGYTPFVKKRETEKMIDEIINDNIVPLKEDRILGTRFDKYGIPHDEGWKSRLEYFIDYVIPYKLPQDYREYYIDVKAIAREKVLLTIPSPSPDEINSLIGQAFSETMTGVEFERFCCDQLTKLGWVVEQTPLSSDQGADIIASKNKLRVAIQCKKFGRPVGNKAVQEIVAARSYYNCNTAAVLANQVFNKSAVELAKSNKVALLHYDDLPNLDSSLILVNLGWSIKSSRLIA